MASNRATSPVAVDTSIKTCPSLPTTPPPPAKRKPAFSTPPDTPVSSNSEDELQSLPSLRSARKSKSKSKRSRAAIIEFPYDLEIVRDNGNTGAYIEYGRGVWSVVYKATSHMSSSSSSSSSSATSSVPSVLTTPPSSPSSKSLHGTGTRVFAVKTPLRRDAHSVLKMEAGILSRITKCAGGIHDVDVDRDVVVPFHGFISSSHSLVFQAVPLSFSAHIETCAESARRSFSTRTMFDPVTGKEQWRDLAAQLIRGLDWLHRRAGVVHGDIKPHNILLRPRISKSDHIGSTGTQSTPEHGIAYDALYADFSSAHTLCSSNSAGLADGNDQYEANININNDDDCTAEQDEQKRCAAGTAWTPPFAAPELLTLEAMRSTTPLSTPASDVFALALTLLAAATGDVLIYPGTNSMQRLAMSREGWRALNYVSSGPNASRLGGKDGLVRRVVECGIVKEPERRIDSRDWLRLLV